MKWIMSFSSILRQESNVFVIFVASENAVKYYYFEPKISMFRNEFDLIILFKTIVVGTFAIPPLIYSQALTVILSKK